MIINLNDYEVVQGVSYYNHVYYKSKTKAAYSIPVMLYVEYSDDCNTVNCYLVEGENMIFLGSAYDNQNNILEIEFGVYYT